MSIRAVVFDIGGVLEITPETGWVERWDKRLGVSLWDIFEKVNQMGLDGRLGPCSEAEWLDGFRKASGFDQTTIDGLMADLWAEYLGTLNQPLYDYLASLRPRYKTGIISNSFVGAREREQAAYGFEDITDDIVYSHEVGMVKPDRRIFELACERLGIRPDEMVFVDDHDDVMAEAREMGVKTVLFSGDNPRTIAEIEAHLKA